MTADDRPSDPWEVHRSEQRECWRELSYADRIRWLDQAKQFVATAMGAARVRTRDRKDDGPYGGG
jgi:hypothetical protein